MLDHVPIDPEPREFGSSGHEQEDVRIVSYLLAAGLAVPIAAIAVVVLLSLVGIAFVSSIGGEPEPAAAPLSTSASKLPAYWEVVSGETLQQIADETGLTVAQLQEFNPDIDPSAILPGQRLKLRAIKEKPKRPKPKGPRFRTVRAGESFGSIAADTGRSIIALEELNPDIKPEKLAPGDRLQLRP